MHEITLISDSKIEKNAKVALVSFTGQVYSRTIAAEWLTYHLQKKVSHRIMSPAMVEKHLAEKGIRLEFYQEQSVKQQTTDEVIRSQPSEMTIKDRNETHNVYKFSTEDLLRIGEIIDVDYLISGSVVPNAQEYVEIQVFDIKKHSLMALLYTTMHEALTYHHGDGEGIKSIVPEIVSLFEKDEKAKK